MSEKPPIAPPDGLLHEVIDYWAGQDPAADFLIDGDRVISYSEGAEAIAGMACRLHAAGVRAGDRICVLTRPTADFAISLFAAFSIGAIWVGLNPRYTKREAEYVINDCQPTLLLLEDALGESGVANARAAAGDIPAYWLAAAPGDGGLPEGSAAKPDAPALSPESPAFIVYTSGTTGEPKGAVVPHRAPRRVGHAMHSELAIERPRVLDNFPCNHVGGVSEIAISTFVAGGCVVFQQQFDPAAGFELIEKHRISLWMQVPTMFQLALDDPAFENADVTSIEAIAFGGAAPSPELIRRLREICPYLTNTYGLTETVGGMTWTRRDADDAALTDTVGYVPSAFEMRIADDDHELERGEVGEIQFRGDYLFREYWNRPEATAATFTQGGWLRTGDLGRIDGDGALRLTGRLKEMFKSGGYNVYPLEVEQWIATHEAVVEVVVVPMPDATFVEVGCAFVQLDAASSADADELHTHCREGLANYKIPKRWEFVDEFPVLPNSKIDRGALADRATALAQA